MKMKLRIGDIYIGDGEKIAIQSMTNTNTADVKATVSQIKRLEEAGCDIVRCTVPDMEAADAIKEIKKQIKIPLVADIHFDYRLAIEAVKNGVDKVRINPGNIGGEDRVKAVVEAMKERNIPLRIGVNGGSLDKKLLEKYGKVCPEALVESAKEHIDLVNKFGYDNIVVSLKSSDTKLTVDSYRLFKKTFSYPLHVGVTEAGTVYNGIIKSAVGIGALLLDGIGDTIRVSLTADPCEEIKAGKSILAAAGLLRDSVNVISCPTCGRTKIDLIKIADIVNEAVKDIKKPIKVAVMGCVVNGPGEAKEADIGIAGGDGCAVLFKKGAIIRKIKEEEIAEVLIEEINKL
ncbi:MAG: flavodoxin-dependent (E)-4-hydroxy-3-methylbut-2-enyl-diphosphate synthase [Ruminococcaceae bacterium]|nr:flavodoxin-dependent (E)-4-hydroxy-3-methylbut-2-enyl-diphosphate synthase [Oscillospiraceae bacterium]